MCPPSLKYNSAEFSSEGHECGESGGSSGNESRSSRERDVKCEGTGFSTVIDKDFFDSLLDSDNFANFVSAFLNAKERSVVENNSCNSSCSIDFDFALAT